MKDDKVIALLLSQVASSTLYVMSKLSEYPKSQSIVTNGGCGKAVYYIEVGYWRRGRGGQGRGAGGMSRASGEYGLRF